MEHRAPLPPYITFLKGARRFYYLYTVLDIFSRYVVGWMIAEQESALLAEQLIGETCTKQGIQRDQLALHSDRGSAMRSKTVAELLIQLRVAKSHSRPHTPTDNPYSESQFKTMKYRPDYPMRFDSREEAVDWARAFFSWYNEEHHHVGLELMTPAAVHYGRAEVLYTRRTEVLATAYIVHPERFVRGEPMPRKWPAEVWINRPQSGHEQDPSAAPAARENEPVAQAVSRA
jgi:putative transposase